jgi:hypothetical protein
MLQLRPQAEVLTLQADQGQAVSGGADSLSWPEVTVRLIPELAIQCCDSRTFNSASSGYP